MKRTKRKMGEIVCFPFFSVAIIALLATILMCSIPFPLLLAPASPLASFQRISLEIPEPRDILKQSEFIQATYDRIEEHRVDELLSNNQADQFTGPVSTNFELNMNSDSETVFMKRLDPPDKQSLHSFRTLGTARREQFATRWQLRKTSKQQPVSQAQATQVQDIKVRCFVQVREPIKGNKPGGIGISPMYRGPFRVAADHGFGDYLLQSIVDPKKTKLANSKDLKWFAPPMNGPTKDLREPAALTNTLLYEIEKSEDVKSTKVSLYLLLCIYLVCAWKGYDETKWEPLHHLVVDVPKQVQDFMETLPPRLRKFKPSMLQALQQLVVSGGGSAVSGGGSAE
jgi:hypothetical protein